LTILFPLAQESELLSSDDRQTPLIGSHRIVAWFTVHRSANRRQEAARTGSNLGSLFASHSITADTLKAMTAKIGVTRAALRDTHLKYHLQTAQILTPEQMQRYSVLRG